MNEDRKNEDQTSTNWTELAVQAMQQQEEAERQQTASAQEAEASLPAAAVAMLAAKFLFLLAVAYFLVDQFGIVHLVWLALVGYFLIWPTVTRHSSGAWK